jgi:hypothetical protein
MGLWWAQLARTSSPDRDEADAEQHRHQRRPRAQRDRALAQELEAAAQPPRAKLEREERVQARHAQDGELAHERDARLSVDDLVHHVEQDEHAHGDDRAHRAERKRDRLAVGAQALEALDQRQEHARAQAQAKAQQAVEDRRVERRQQVRRARGGEQPAGLDHAEHSAREQAARGALEEVAKQVHPGLPMTAPSNDALPEPPPYPGPAPGVIRSPGGPGWHTSSA